MAAKYSIQFVIPPLMGSQASVRVQYGILKSELIGEKVVCKFASAKVYDNYNEAIIKVRDLNFTNDSDGNGDKPKVNDDN